MKRMYLDKLSEWKEAEKRKPLLLQGARQVGKTWLMKEFGKNYFNSMIYVNFEIKENLKSIFKIDYDIHRIIQTLELEFDVVVDANNTLIIFDEIQEVENGLNALKYFYENAPQYFIIAAGSLLGLAMNPKQSFPVGKVDFLKIHPLTFEEYLLNANQEKLLGHLRQKNWKIIEPFHDKLITFLRQYYFLGGMPEVLETFFKTGDYNQARIVQQKILMGYEYDFAKHAPLSIVPRIRLVWQNILAQLAKENKKFIYGQIKKGARASDFEIAISWLVDAGLIIKVSRITKINLPLGSYGELDAFKLYLVDVGLLNAIAKIDAKILLDKNNILTEFKGAITEQYVCQQLKAHYPLFYWANENGMAEVDFILQNDDKIIPIEVKAEENVKAKSLKIYTEIYNSPTAVRTSMNFYRHQEWMENIPLYAIGLSDDLII